MASEIHLRYSLTYDIDIDVELAKQFHADLWDDADGELELFEEFVLDYVRENLSLYEAYDELGRLPQYVTSFSVTEES